MKTWKPDTCGCHIEEIYVGTEITGAGAILDKCTVHQSVLDEELYDTIRSENTRKNQTFRVLLGLEGVDLGISETKKEGLALKEGIEYKWGFTGEGKDRVLTVEVPGANLVKEGKDSIKAVADTKFGEGKVEIK